MFRNIRKKRLEKHIKKVLLKRDASQLNKKVEHIAFIFDGRSIKDASFFKPILDTLLISEENVDVLSFATYNKGKTSLEHQFTKKDFSWQGNIQSKKIRKFIKKDMDLLICYYNGKNQYLDSISARSKAAFKIGFRGSDQRILDLKIDIDISDVHKVSTEIKKYLTILGKI